MKEIGVVILNYKNYHETECCLKSMLKQKGIHLEIVVVDNCSQNESVEVLKKWEEQYKNIEIIVSNENVGYAKGNNLGIKRLLEKKVDFIILSNSDIVFTADNIIEALYNGYKPGIGIMTPIIKNLDEKIEMRTQYKSNLFYLRVFKHLFNMQVEYRKNNEQVNKKNQELGQLKYVELKPGIQNDYFSLTGCFFALTPEYLSCFPFIFPETFLYGEEIATLVLNRKLGLRTAIVATNYVIHKQAASTDASLSEGSEQKRKMMVESAKKTMKLIFMPRFVIRKKYSM